MKMHQPPMTACSIRDQTCTASQRLGDELLQQVAAKLLLIDQLYKQSQANPNAVPEEILRQLQQLRSAFLGLLDEQLCKVAPPWLESVPKQRAAKVIVSVASPPTSGLPPPNCTRPPLSVRLGVCEQRLSDLLDQHATYALHGSTVSQADAASKEESSRGEDTDLRRRTFDQAQGHHLEASSPFVSGQFACLQAEPNLCQSSRAAEPEPDSGLAKLETFLHQDAADAPRRKPVKLSVASRQPSYREKLTAAENSVLEAEIDAIKEDSLGEELAAHSSKGTFSGAASAFSDTASVPASPSGKATRDQPSSSQADMPEPSLANGTASISSRSVTGRLEANRPPSLQCPPSPSASSPRPAPAPAAPVVPPLVLPPREHVVPQLQGIHSSSGISDKSDQSRAASRKTSFTDLGRTGHRAADTAYGLDDRDQLGPLQRAMARSRAGTNSGSGAAPAVQPHHIGSDGVWSTTSASAVGSASASRRASDEPAPAPADAPMGDNIISQPAARATGSSTGLSGGGYSSSSSGGGGLDITRSHLPVQPQRSGGYGAATGAWGPTRPPAPTGSLVDNNGPSQGPLARHLARVRSERAAAAATATQPSGMPAGLAQASSPALPTPAMSHPGDVTPPAPDVAVPQGLVSTSSTISNATCEYSHDSNVSQVPEMEPRRPAVPARMKKKPVMPQFLRDALAHPGLPAGAAGSSAMAAGSAGNDSPDSMHTCQTGATDTTLTSATSAMHTQASFMTAASAVAGGYAPSGQADAAGSQSRTGFATPTTSLKYGASLGTIPEGHDGSITPTRAATMAQAAGPAGSEAAGGTMLGMQPGSHMQAGEVQSMQSMLEAELQRTAAADTPELYYQTRQPSQPGMLQSADVAHSSAGQTSCPHEPIMHDANASVQQGLMQQHEQRSAGAVSAGPGGWVADLQQQQDWQHDAISQQHAGTGQSFDFMAAPTQQQHVWPAAPPSIPSYPCVPEHYQQLVPEQQNPMRTSVAERARMFSQLQLQQQQQQQGAARPPGMGVMRAAPAAPPGRQLLRSVTTSAAMPGPQTYPPWQAAGASTVISGQPVMMMTLQSPSPEAAFPMAVSGLQHPVPYGAIPHAAVMPAASSVASYSPADLASGNPSPGSMATPGAVLGRTGISPMRGASVLRPEDSAQHMGGGMYAGPGAYHGYHAAPMSQHVGMSQRQFMDNAAQYGMPRPRSVSPPVAAGQRPAVVAPVVDIARVAFLPGLGGAPNTSSMAKSDAQQPAAQRTLVRNATMPVSGSTRQPQHRPSVSPPRDPSPEAAATEVRFQIRTASQKDAPAWAPPGVSAAVVNRQRSISPTQGLPLQTRGAVTQQKAVQDVVSPRLVKIHAQTQHAAQDMTAMEASFDGMLGSGKRQQQVVVPKQPMVMNLPRNIPGVSVPQAPTTAAATAQQSLHKTVGPAGGAGAGKLSPAVTPAASQAGSRAGTPPPPPPPGPPPPPPALGTHTPIVVKKGAGGSTAPCSVGSSGSPAPTGVYGNLVESIKALGANGEHRAHLRSLSKSKAKRGAKGQARVGGQPPSAGLQAEHSAASSGHSSAHSLLSQRDMAVSQQRAHAQAQQFMDRLRCVIPAEAQGYDESDDDDDFQN